MRSYGILKQNIMTRTELLEHYLKPTDLTVKELIDRDAFAQIMQFAEAYRLEQLRIGGVLKSLPTDEEIYSEGCNYVRKIEQPNRQPIITLRRTFKAGAEFVKKQLDK